MMNGCSQSTDYIIWLFFTFNLILLKLFDIVSDFIFKFALYKCLSGYLKIFLSTLLKLN